MNTASHRARMRRLLQGIVFTSVLLTLACSNRQASDTSKADTLNQSSPVAAVSVALEGYVTDAAHILSPEEKAVLSERLAKLERKTKHQMVIVTVPSLGGRDIAAFTRDLANSWGIGRKGYDDGVVFLTAPQERRVRIAVGRGLEKRLSDSVCQEVITESVLPNFRKGNLPAGIKAGTDALIAHLK